MRRERHDRYMARLRIGLKTTCGLPAINDRQVQVHQDDIRPLCQSRVAPLRTILGYDDLELLKQFQTHLQHVDVIVVVLDVQKFGHNATSVLGAAWSSSRRIRATRSSGLKDSLISTD